MAAEDDRSEWDQDSDPVDGQTEPGQKVRDLEGVLNIAKSLTASTSVDEVMDTVRFTCYANFRSSDVHTFLLQEPVDADWVLLRSRFTDLQISLSDPLFQIFQEGAEAFTISELNHSFPGSPVLKTLAGLGVQLVVPMRYRQKLNGLICLNEKEEGSTVYSEREHNYISEIATFASIAIEKAVAYEAAVHDRKTGLYHYSFFLSRLGQEMVRVKRYDAVLSIILFDLDQFRKVNDGLGHLAGDEVLKRFRSLLMTHLRESDVAARAGGEEFIVLLPHIDTSRAAAVADRIRKIQEREIFHGPRGNFEVTVSAGVASFHPDSQVNEARLLELVGKAMQKAKKQGRNRVVQAEA